MQTARRFTSDLRLPIKVQRLQKPLCHSTVARSLRAHWQSHCDVYRFKCSFARGPQQPRGNAGTVSMLGLTAGANKTLSWFGRFNRQ
jgi:hypothetical protein